MYDGEVYLVGCIGHENKLDVTFAMAGESADHRERRTEVLL